MFLVAGYMASARGHENTARENINLYLKNPPAEKFMKYLIQMIIGDETNENSTKR